MMGRSLYSRVSESKGTGRIAKTNRITCFLMLAALMIALSYSGQAWAVCSSSITVTGSADSGSGSLRQALFGCMSWRDDNI